MRFFSAFLILVLTSFRASLAQDVTITGSVHSSSDGQAMPFVTVSVSGSNNAVSTDIDGKFSIRQVSPADTLIFSFVGYSTQRVRIGSQNEIHIRLDQSAKQLNEVVVTALGVNRQKRELGYSTEKIDGREIRQSNSPNILNAITGKAGGVQIVNPDGVDGGTTRITIRGNNSINNDNQPIIIVDGVILNNDPGLTNVGRGRDWGSAINNINMEDVESINILKGGAASALYGAMGANGAILVTMKKGKKQKGIGISYNMTYKVTHPYRYRDVQNVYGGGAPSTSFSAPAFELGADSMPVFPSLGTDPEFGYPGSAVSWGPKMNGQIIKWWDGSLRPWSPQPDNLAIPFHDGHQATHNVSAEGGGDVGTMRISLSRTDNTPIVQNSHYNQTTINTNSTLKVSEKIRLNFSASYIDYHRLNSPMLGEDAQSYSKGLLYSWPRSYMGEDKMYYSLSDGTRNLQENYPYLYVDRHLWWNYYNHNTTLDRSKVLGGLSLNYTITKWLSFTGRTGIDYTTDQFTTKHKPVDLIGLQEGYYGETTISDKSFNSEFLFAATRKNIFNTGLSVALNAGGASWSRDMHGLSARSGTWYFPNWYSLSNFTPGGLESWPTQEFFYSKKINSLYAFLNISWKEYLFAEITARNDWSSTLPADANSYLYAGASVSFIASEALKFKSEKISFCKIRAGATQTALDTKPYQTEFYYDTQLFGGEQSSSFGDTIPPISLSPQLVNAYEGGLTLGFFNDRLTVDFTYYYKYSFDQIIALSVPVSSGAPKVVINDGVLTNKGFEILLGATVLQKSNFIFKTGLVFSRNRNQVVSLGDFDAPYQIADIWSENGPTMALYPGDDFGTIVGWDYVYQNGKRVVNAEGTKYEITPTRVPIGNASPDFLAGWNTEFRYRNFTLRTLIDTKWGGDIYCGSCVTGLQTGQSPETLEERDGGGLPYTDPSGNTTNSGIILEGVHEDGSPNMTVVHYYYKYLPNAGGWGHFLSSPGIAENTWVKFREASLSFEVPEKLVKKLKIFQSLGLSLTGRDLFYIYTTLPDHINPEGTMGAGDAQGFEWGSLPGVRSWSFGVNARF